MSERYKQMNERRSHWPNSLRVDFHVIQPTVRYAMIDERENRIGHLFHHQFIMFDFDGPVMSEYETDVPSFSLKLYVLRSIRYPEDKGGDTGINDIVLSIAVHPLMTYSYVVSAYQAAKKEKKKK